ncbi:MAG: hypothetical protein R3C10_15525 [Pirellulales bacterium]
MARVPTFVGVRGLRAALGIRLSDAQQPVERDAIDTPQQSILLERARAKLAEYVAEEKRAYEDVRTLDEAIDVLQRRLTQRGLSEVVPLLDARRVKTAIRRAVEWEVMQSSGVVSIAEILPSGRDDVDRSTLHRAKYFLAHAQPRYRTILDSADWPRGAYFMISSGGQKALGDCGLYVTLHLGAESSLDTGDETRELVMHSINVLSVCYGEYGAVRLNTIGVHAMPPNNLQLQSSAAPTRLEVGEPVRSD